MNGMVWYGKVRYGWYDPFGGDGRDGMRWWMD